MSEKKLLLGDEAVALGALHAGLSGVYAYPGTPSTEITEYIQQSPLARERGVRSRWCTNEKTAMEAALGMSYAGKRALVCMKHVGMNVCADAFVNAAVTGVKGGLVVVAADDPSMHSSQNEQDSRFYGKFAMVPILEPSDQQDAFDMMADAFALSEALRLPVLLRLVTRLAHSRAAVRTGSPLPQKPFSPDDERTRWVLLPGNAKRQYASLVARQPEIAACAEQSGYNRLEMPAQASGALGVIAVGIAYNYVREVLPAGVPVLKLSQYPVPARQVRDLAARCGSLLVVEDGQPFVEEGDPRPAWGGLSRPGPADRRPSPHRGTDAGLCGRRAGRGRRAAAPAGGPPLPASAPALPGLRPQGRIRRAEPRGGGVPGRADLRRHRLLHAGGASAFPRHRQLCGHGGVHHDGQGGGRRRPASRHRRDRRFHLHPFRDDRPAGRRQ